jgi:hypothetical protein
VAGSLYVAGTTAYAAVVAVEAGPGDTVVVSAAAGGVGSVAVQLARRRGATVIGLASEPNHACLKARGVVPVAYGEGVAERIRQACGGNVDAFIDTFGEGYVELAVELGVRPQRIDTIREWQAAANVGAVTLHAPKPNWDRSTTAMDQVLNQIDATEGSDPHTITGNTNLSPRTFDDQDPWDYAFHDWRKYPSLNAHPGFRIAEIDPDKFSNVSSSPNTGAYLPTSDPAADAQRLREAVDFCGNNTSFPEPAPQAGGTQPFNVTCDAVIVHRTNLDSGFVHHRWVFDPCTLQQASY